MYCNECTVIPKRDESLHYVRVSVVKRGFGMELVVSSVRSLFLPCCVKPG